MEESLAWSNLPGAIRKETHMSNEVSVILFTPTIRITKATPNNLVEVRADNPAEDVSIHYDVHRDAIPKVHEQLLVAVLSGVPSEWLHAKLSGDGTREPEPIVFNDGADKAEKQEAGKETFLQVYQSHDPTRTIFRIGVGLEEQRALVVELDRRQVKNLLAALLSIHRRMRD